MVSAKLSATINVFESQISKNRDLEISSTHHRSLRVNAPRSSKWHARSPIEWPKAELEDDSSNASFPVPTSYKTPKETTKGTGETMSPPGTINEITQPCDACRGENVDDGHGPTRGSRVAALQRVIEKNDEKETIRKTEVDAAPTKQERPKKSNTPAETAPGKKFLGGLPFLKNVDDAPVIVRKLPAPKVPLPPTVVSSQSNHSTSAAEALEKAIAAAETPAPAPVPAVEDRSEANDPKPDEFDDEDKIAIGDFSYTSFEEQMKVAVRRERRRQQRRNGSEMGPGSLRARMQVFEQKS